VVHTTPTQGKHGSSGTILLSSPEAGKLKKLSAKVNSLFPHRGQGLNAFFSSRIFMNFCFSPVVIKTALADK